jgi:hypothetical protein
MGDHYIPEYYLKGFTSLMDNMLWVFEKGGSLKFKSGVSNIGHEINYYSAEVEQYLANEIEGPANTVINKIRERGHLQESDKEKLATYMVVMLKRVPQSKICMKEMAPDVAKKQQEQWDAEISKLIAEDSTKADLLNKRREEIRVNLDIYSKDPPKDFWLSLIPPERTPNIVNVLNKMTWHFLTCDNFPAFLTCDNPVFYFQWLGIGKPESEVTFPISSNIVLWATWRKDLKQWYSQIKSQAIREINRRTVSNAMRFVYHEKDEYWIPKLINKARHQFNRLI